MGESGGTCRPMMQSIILCDHVTERDVIGQCDLIVEHERAYRLVCGVPGANQDLSVCEKNGYPKVNQDFVCLLSNRGLQNKPRLCLFVMGKSGGTSCFSMIEQSDIIRAISLPNATLRGNWLYWAVNVGSPEQTKILSVCYGGKRRYMSPNDAKHHSLRACYRTREQSDIIRATSLPNATSSFFATMLPNATSSVNATLLPNATQMSEVDKRCLNAPQSLYRHIFLSDSVVDYLFF